MKALFFLLLVSFSLTLAAQQLADTTYNPDIGDPEYAPGKGPVVFIDEGHHNFHTKDGRYRSFAALLERDGYVVEAYTGKFEMAELEKGKILVISNALNEINVEDWYLPNPSAFSRDEIKILKKWVRKGGSLFLIADHMPIAGAAQDLAAVFKFEFTNGFAFDTTSRGPAFFSRDNGTLVGSVITNGRGPEEAVSKVASFTGQAFRAPRSATEILVFGANFVNLIPDTAWVFTEATPMQSAEGWLQGAYRTFGKGKIVAFGEAAMFSAQLAGPTQIRIGMSSDMAPENYRLLLNIIHWLDGRLE